MNSNLDQMILQIPKNINGKVKILGIIKCFKSIKKIIIKVKVPKSLIKML